MQTVEQIAAVAERVGPAVVGLRGGRGGGSGVVIAPGRVLTLAHRLRTAEVEVALRSGTTETGSVLGADHELNVAVIDVPTGDAPALDWATDVVDIGTAVFALGDPGGAGLRVTPGTVSARPLTLRGRRGRPLEGVIEHTAPLPRGAGGGPLVNADGRLLGINAMRQDGGLILALPAQELQPRVAALLAGRSTRPRRLGVAVLSPRAARRMRAAVGLPERDGLLVRSVDEDAPAGRAGVAPGDLLVAIDGRPLTSIDELYAALDAADGRLELGVVRGADELTLPLELEEARE